MSRSRDNAASALSTRTIPASGCRTANEPSGTWIGNRRSASTGLEAVPFDPAGLERARRAFLERPDDLEQAVQLEQRLAALGLELTPEPERLLSQAHVLLFGVCQPEDA
jgi:hypothetical protein